MKVLTVVGARPQFIKAAMVSRELRKKHREVLVHTGQHYDYNMSEQFFKELSIPRPDHNLGISGGSHAVMTGQMMIALEEVMLQEKPDWVLLYGDTNSTLAAALVAAKLYLPICHVEAGARTYSKTNPEEMNRICTDHLSSLLLTSTASGMDHLKAEGLLDRSMMAGDPMYDAFLEYSAKAAGDFRLSLLSGGERDLPETFYYLTCHREENTKTDDILKEIFDAMDALGAPVIYPVHPRNKARALRLQEQIGYGNLILTEPVGYMESIWLVNHAEKIVTDSGGLQREAFFARKKCVTILDFVVWPETMVMDRNHLAKPKKDDILRELAKEQRIDPDYRPFGDGHAAAKIVKAMEETE